MHDEQLSVSDVITRFGAKNDSDKIAYIRRLQLQELGGEVLKRCVDRKVVVEIELGETAAFDPVFGPSDYCVDLRTTARLTEVRSRNVTFEHIELCPPPVLAKPSIRSRLRSFCRRYRKASTDEFAKSCCVPYDGPRG